MPFALTDRQLALVMTAGRPLDPSKRATLLERVASHLRRIGADRPIATSIGRSRPR
jgi:hypothetical protein